MNRDPATGAHGRRLHHRDSWISWRPSVQIGMRDQAISQESSSRWFEQVCVIVCVCFWRTDLWPAPNWIVFNFFLKTHMSDESTKIVLKSVLLCHNLLSATYRSWLQWLRYALFLCVLCHFSFCHSFDDCVLLSVRFFFIIIICTTILFSSCICDFASLHQIRCHNSGRVSFGPWQPPWVLWSQI